MERVKQKKVKVRNDIDSEIPTAPTMEDFHFDPGIREGSPELLISSKVSDIKIRETTERIEDLTLTGTETNLESDTGQAIRIYFSDY